MNREDEVSLLEYKVMILEKEVEELKRKIERLWFNTYGPQEPEK